MFDANDFRFVAADVLKAARRSGDEDTYTKADTLVNECAKLRYPDAAITLRNRAADELGVYV